ncbi:dihydroorotase [Pseudohongiella nitratireducens]|uniref:Dihydroorotase n=1 Tax=Pseudohongiella nitratireducens TaxID=1768907 RepID=A0A917GJR6_9GAMM|nr:dihydroorotase [Pseudohongiella nitratireducens]MDF1623882.1 dihydroorotase [Pseudohongiella nitratireducens]GGG48343.1 dihydroorotase [Pseudohongiella nitratireducens]|tara:strand:- start:20 stop:1063 length:1044 start_codon:yes stop_codon:yes gene_type:complete
MLQEITITRPDDWHLHVRDGEALNTTVPHTAATFGRAIIMPNLKPPVTTASEAAAYRQRIIDARPTGSNFDPLMTLYLTDRLSSEEIQKAAAHPDIYAVKYYPAGATTNSDSGVTAIENVYPALEAMSDAGLPLLLHGEVTDNHVDIFDREKRFIDTILSPLLERFPDLRVVLEHITTADAAQFVAQASSNIAATLTPQHLMYNRNDMLVGGVRPHLYCLPILKRNIHQTALLEAATSGNPKFFLGTDSAPHAQHTKETSCGCAGCYSAFAAMSLYAEIFEQADALDKLEAFSAFYGADFYGLPRNRDKIVLRKEAWQVPDAYSYLDTDLVPLCAGQTLNWKVVDYV